MSRDFMRTYALFFGLLLVGCAASSSSPERIDSGVASPRQEVRSPETEGVVAVMDSWGGLYQKHGENLFGVEKSELNSATYNVSRKELVFEFHYAAEFKPEGLVSSKVLDYGRVQRELGAVNVGKVPSEFMMLCGENHGGDFQVGAVKYGIYVSGGCHQIRIFDPTPDAIKLLLGADFVDFLQPCLDFDFGPICRSETTVRLKASDEPKMSFLVFDGFKPQQPKITVDGWLEVELPEKARGRDLKSFIYAAGGVRCDLELPPLSPMEACGLTGSPYVPKASTGR